MASILVVSADSKAIETVEQLVRQAGSRVRSVHEASSALQWIAMQLFDIVLVDSRFGGDIPTSVLEAAWKQNPLTVGVVFNLYGEVEKEWIARLAGARVFSGPRAETGLGELFANLPEELVPFPDLRILLVDDLESPRHILSEYITAMGYVVETAGSVDEALSLLAKSPQAYFSVITDLNMPSKDGFHLLDAIRENTDTKALPVLILTAYHTLENLLECVKLGATGFLAKPPKKKNLRAELEKCYRLFLTKQSPRLCRPEEAHLLEHALARLSLP